VHFAVQTALPHTRHNHSRVYISNEYSPKQSNIKASGIKACGYCVIKKLNSVAGVRERTIPTERPPLVGEVSANFCG
jgi:hypothetical protein